MLYLVVLFLTIIIFPKIVISLGMFQQNHYEVKKYFKNLKKHYLKTISTYLEYVAIIVLIGYYLLPVWYMIVLEIFFILGSFMLTEQLIILPKITKRIKRLVVTLTLLSLIPYFICPFHTLIFLLETVFMPFLVIIASLINYPIEKQVNKYYYQKAKIALSKTHPLIIGITGSYGKTSTKNYLYHLLKDNYLTYPTPASYNTPMGICKCINEEFRPLSEVFVVELGATKEGDITELVDLVDVNIGIITEIGPQHLESFGSIEKVLETKLEILKSKSLEVLVINSDNAYLRNASYPQHLKVITIGIEKDADYVAQNINLTNQGLMFDIYKKGEFLTNIQTKLLGKHNIYNLLLAIAVGEYLDISIADMVKKILSIEPVKHRLSLNQIGHLQIIDDAFNSNVVGFQNALEVLKLANNKKIVITPGIVDLGIEMSKINYEIGNNLITQIDKVYLIDNECAKYIEKCFNDKGFENYEVVKSFNEAYHKATKIYKNEPVSILIENDLPDNYLRR